MVPQPPASAATVTAPAAAAVTGVSPRAGVRVSVRDLVVVRGGLRVLRGVSASFDPGTVTLLRGANGSGKSTLLLTLAGCLPVTCGEVSRLRRGDVALVPQAPPSADRLPVTVRTVVEMGRWPRAGLLGRLRQADRAAVARAMEVVGVTDLAGRQLSRISGGQLQRALVAQALASGAQVLLLDEPTASADVESARIIHEAVRDRARRGATVVMASHDPTAQEYADTVLELADGRAVGGSARQAVSR